MAKVGATIRRRKDFHLAKTLSVSGPPLRNRVGGIVKGLERSRLDPEGGPSRSLSARGQLDRRKKKKKKCFGKATKMGGFAERLVEWKAPRSEKQG